MRKELPDAGIFSHIPTHIYGSDSNLAREGMCIWVYPAIEKTPEKRGLDNKSKEHYVDLLWKYAESEKPEDEKRQLQSLRILGKAFIAEQVSVDKPETLPLDGRFREGLDRMGLGDEVVAKRSQARETDLDEDEERATFDA
jgi:hypothetical protein